MKLHNFITFSADIHTQNCKLSYFIFVDFHIGPKEESLLNILSHY